MTSAPRHLLRWTDVSICHQPARVSTINKVVVTLLHNFQSASGRTGLRELERREPGRCSVLPGARADRCLRSVSWDGAFSVTATRRLAGVCVSSKIDARTARDLFGFGASRPLRGERGDGGGKEISRSSMRVDLAIPSTLFTPAARLQAVLIMLRHASMS